MYALILNVVLYPFDSMARNFGPPSIHPASRRTAGTHGTPLNGRVFYRS